MTAAELEQISSELAAIEAEQKALLACLFVYELPEDLAAQWRAGASKDSFDPESPEGQLGPRALWVQLLIWAMCLVCLAVAVTWRGHRSQAGPGPAAPLAEPTGTTP